MAGGGEAEDNPVNINVVPMVDVIFCLCVFFMCSFKFKQLEGRFQSWLPKDLGNGQVTPDQPIEMRVAMYWDEQKGEVVRQYGNRFVKEDEELESLISGAHKDFVAQNHPNAPVIVDYRVWGMGVAAIIALSIAVGLLPALKARRLSIVDALAR